MVRCESRAISLTGGMGGQGAQARGSWLFDVDRAGAPNTQLKPLAVWLSSACGPAADHGMAALTDAAILSRLDLHRPGRFAVIAG